MNDLPVLRLVVSVGPLLRAVRHWCFFLFLPLLLMVGCGVEQDNPDQAQATGAVGTFEVTRRAPTAPPPTPQLELAMIEDEVSIDPLPLRAGFPFTLTTSVHNNSDLLAIDIPLMVFVSARREEIGYTSFLHLFTMTLPASQTVPLTVPVDWNFAGGEHQLWIQANRLPDAWHALASVQPEVDLANNIVLLDLMIDPFDAYTSDLCSGRVDVEVGPADVLPDPDRQLVLVRVHNLGNRAVYNLPVVITGDKMAGIAYTPAIPPCGGTAEVSVQVDRPLQEGEALTVRVNPGNWENALQEDNSDNNQVTVAAGLAPGVAIPPEIGLEDYDFRLDTGDIETPELWTVLVTVQNLGTRDAAMVPIQIENEAGRKIVDAIPLIQGEGIGTAAFRVGYLWTPGGTLTFTLNPQDDKGAYPEINRDNNVATFVLP